MKNTDKLLKQIEGLIGKLDEFNTELNDLKKEIESSSAPDTSITAEAIQVPEPPAISTPPVTPEVTAVVPPPFPPQAKETVTPEATPVPPVQSRQPYQPPSMGTPPPVQPPKPPKVKKSFFERHPDLEKLVGEKLIPFIGILVFVIGIGFLVSWAIEKDYIGETGRVGIGIAAGGLLIGIAHWLRKGYRTFSSILIGGGIATLYFTIAYAHHVYRIFGPPGSNASMIAFSIMVVITAFTVGFSLLYNRKEVAILALLGGFATPVLASDGSGNYIALFTYLLILNVGMTILSYFKNWKILHILAFFLTVLVFGSWMTAETFDGTLPKQGALVFATAFFVIFFLMNIIYNLTKKEKFRAIEYIIILMNSFAYFAAGLYIVDQYHEGLYNGVFTGSVALFHFVFAFMLYRREGVDRNVVYTLIGLVLTFLTMAAPIQLEGNYITLFWACEAVLLLWLGQRSNIGIMKTGSIVVTFCMLLSLIIDWSMIADVSFVHVYDEQFVPMSVLLNKVFIGSFVSVLSLVGVRWLLTREEEGSKFQFFGGNLFSTAGYSKMFPLLTMLVAYFGGLIEIIYQLNARDVIHDFHALAISSYSIVFVVAIYLLTQRNKNLSVSIAALMTNFLAIFSYFTTAHFNTIELRNESLMIAEVSNSWYYFHYVCTIGIIALVYLMSKQFKTTSWLQGIQKYFVWFAMPVLLLLFGAELDHFMAMNSSGTWEGIQAAIIHSHKTGYPIVWGLVAFTLMYLGLKKKLQQLRIASLALILITVTKISIDLWGMSDFGKIIACISLGIILLVIAFMYQKLKKLLLDADETTEETPTTLNEPQS